jgi:hypothetical protein
VALPINPHSTDPSSASSERVRASGAEAEKAINKQILPRLTALLFPRLKCISHFFRKETDMFKLVAAVTFAASLAASAQMDMKPSGHQSTDKEKIADALRAGPLFITKDAVIADWPTDPKAPNAEYRVLQAGKSDWTCLPGIPGYSHDEPMCLDKTSMQWIKDSLAERPVHIDQIGVMYMFSGAWVPDLHGTSHSADHTYHVGPHAMIISPHNEDLAKFNRDGSTGQIYISHLPGHSELYLIIPFKDWPTQ